MNKVRFPVMLMIMVALAIAIGVTYYVKTRPVDPVDQATQELPEGQTPIEDRWDEWDDPSGETPEYQDPGMVRSFDDALAMSKQTGKLVMLFFTSDRAETDEWVPKMRKTLADPKVAEAISQFIFYEVNCDREPPRYRLAGYPTIAVVDGNGTVQKHLVGYKGVLAFKVWLRDGVFRRSEPVPPEYPQLEQPQLEQPPQYPQPEYPPPSVEPEPERRFRIFPRSGG